MAEPAWSLGYPAPMWFRKRNAKDERGRPLYTTRDWAAWVLTGDPD